MEMFLENRVALVTGGATGIGAASAIALAQVGADVVIGYHRSCQDAAEVVRTIGGLGRRAAMVQADLSDPAEAARWVCEALAAVPGPMQVLVNNAGDLIERCRLDEMPAELWERTIALNLSSVFHVTRACLSHLADGGRIINVTSIAAHTGGSVGAAAYAAAKGGVITLSRAMALELAPRSITVNAISPGVIMTRFHERYSTPERLAALRSQIPLGRLGNAEDCAGAVRFLASPAAAFITGEILEVNGGQHFA